MSYLSKYLDRSLLSLLMIPSLIGSLFFFKGATVAASYSSSATINPSSPSVGTSVNGNAKVTVLGQTIPDGILDVEIYNSANQKIYQRFFEHQYLSDGQEKSFDFNWTPSQAGSYKVKLGLFANGWSSLYNWNNSAANVSVANAVVASASTQSVVEVWWPTEAVSVNGLQPFKAMLENRLVNDYKMFWQVDNGQWNEMWTNYTDYPHKEAPVDVTNWNWRGQGPYVLNFQARSLDGQVLGQKRVTIYVGSMGNNTTPTNNSGSTNVPSDNGSTGGNNSSNTTPATPPASNGENVLAGYKLYLNGNNNAKNQADTWRNSRPGDAAQMDKIAHQPTADWIGEWSGDVKSAVDRITSAAAAQGQVPTFVAYNIPQRDLGSYSAGGVANADAYKSWIRSFAEGLKGRKSIVILEPDALAQMDGLDASNKQARYDLLNYAVKTLKAQGQTKVYIDAAHPGWIGAGEMANRLKAAGVAQADGFALNVSNFTSTNDNIAYGQEISRNIGNKHFVIDTSRNGLGAAANGEWCNPEGRALGEKPTVNTGKSLVDAYLWVKYPGESDGSRNGAPAAGTWWPEYALGLAQRANW